MNAEVRNKPQWNKVKTDLEYLNLQLALGRSEAKETFEREWKKLSGFIEDQSHRLRRYSGWADHLVEELIKRAISLKSIIREEAPDNEKSFDRWRGSILRNVYELEFIISEIYPVLSDDEKELLSDFRISMELYHAKLLTIKASELNSIIAQTAHLTDKIDEVLDWNEKESQSFREKIQQFGEEIGGSFDNVKMAFGKLFR